jgi:nucleoid DNA-binding protein
MPKKRNKVFNRDDISRYLQHQTGISASQADKVIELVFLSIRLALQSGRSVHLPNLGILSPIFIKKRRGYNPVDKKIINLKERIRIQFRIGKTLKRIINRDVDLVKNRIEK